MRKFCVFFGVLAIVLMGCASEPPLSRPFNPNVNPLIGEWVIANDVGCCVYTYYEDGRATNVCPPNNRNITGTYTFTDSSITTRTAAGSFPVNYQLRGHGMRVHNRQTNNSWTVILRPYFDLAQNLRTNEAARNEFPVNPQELAGIQGVWRMSGRNQVTYTFSGTNFTLTSAQGRAPRYVSGTFKINDGIVLFLVNNEPVGVFTYEHIGNTLLFSAIWGTDGYTWWGDYVKQ